MMLATQLRTGVHYSPSPHLKMTANTKEKVRQPIEPLSEKIILNPVLVKDYIDTFGIETFLDQIIGFCNNAPIVQRIGVLANLGYAQELWEWMMDHGKIDFEYNFLLVNPLIQSGFSSDSFISALEASKNSNFHEYVKLLRLPYQERVARFTSEWNTGIENKKDKLRFYLRRYCNPQLYAQYQSEIEVRISNLTYEELIFYSNVYTRAHISESFLAGFLKKKNVIVKMFIKNGESNLFF